MRRFVCLFAAISLLIAGCSGGGVSETTVTSAPPPSGLDAGPGSTAAMTTSSTSTVPATATTELPTSTTAPPAPPPAGSPYAAAPQRIAFAAFEAVPMLSGPAYAGPPRPDAMDEVLVAGALRRVADDPAIAATLLEEGFAVDAGWVEKFHHAYEWPIYEGVPLFVTTDAAFHTWHLAFAKVLRSTEEEVLLPKLEALLSGLLAGAERQVAELTGTPLAEDADRVLQFYQAAAALTGLDPGPLGPLAVEELELARAAAVMAASPITSFGAVDLTASPDQAVDYTQFRPRGHYTATPDLERYFRGMSMLGQTGFFLSSDRSLRLGVLAARPLTADAGLRSLWADIYDPSGFLVGLADDYTPFELVSAVEAVAPGAMGDPTLLDAAAVAGTRQALLASRPVAINPEAASVRVMGARFVLDSFILDQLAWPNVGEEPPELRRVRVSPLDVAAAFGSQFAYDVQDRAGETAYRNYDSQMEAMRGLVAGRQGDDWAGTVYDAWLFALQALWLEHGAEFPPFMQGEAWAAKSHQTGFGSYTELKHDTLLYAKQGFAAEGGGDELAFEPRHWVEPDPVAFQRLAAVAALTRAGLADRGLLTDENAALLDEVEAMIRRFGRIAADELAGRPLSVEDNDWLAAIGSLLEWLWLASTDVDPTVEFPEVTDDGAALVADIFRTTFDVLELGIGWVDSIYVLVPNDAGTYQLAVGGIYSYYEFWQPADLGRLTDEEWRALLMDDAQPARPGWVGEIYVAR